MKLIKNILALMILLISLVPAAGQIEPVPEDIIQQIYNYDYPVDLKQTKYLTIRGENLDELKNMKPGDYKNLEALIIEFNEDPAASDDVKEKKIVTVEKKLGNLACLRNYPSLKYLVLHVGVFLFIRSTDNLPYNSNDKSIQEKADRLNLERLNARFGKKISGMLKQTKIKVYAYNWGW